MKQRNLVIIFASILGIWVIVNLFNLSVEVPLTGSYISKGDYYAKCQKTVFAIAEYEKAIQADPNSFEAHFKLGSMYQNLGEKEKAVQEFQVASKLARKSLKNTYDVEMALASILVAEEQFDEAVNKLKQYSGDSRKVAKKLADIYVDWGKALYSKNDKEQAIARYKEALMILGDVDPEEQVNVETIVVNAYKSMAEDYAWEKNPDKAIDILVKSLDNVYSPVTLNKIGALYEKQGKFDRALDYYRKSYQTNSAVASVPLSQLLLREAEAYAAKDDYATSKKFYEEAKQVNNTVNIPLKVMYPLKIDKITGKWSGESGNSSILPKVIINISNKGEEPINYVRVKASFKDGFRDIGESETIVADVLSPLMPNGTLKNITLSAPTRVMKDSKDHTLSISVSVSCSETDMTGYLHKTVALNYFHPKPKPIEDKQNDGDKGTSSSDSQSLLPLKKQESKEHEVLDLGSL